ncbi:MAG TPA: aminotransferase class I/II-fold pyridoxal phosphate-dependent enzyme, partial [Flavobacteriales bacterium]|nr:aminotransferase class I/II-fold pyridoxal phosphate-dependent enzyme [Flavobacteriales bacterium]
MIQFPSSLTSKLPQTGTTIFTVMSQLAAEHNAINLSQGFPDFPCSDELLSLVSKHMKMGHNQYAPLQGIAPLREILSEKIEKLYSIKYNPDTEINITAGATQAIYTAITALVQEGDEVVVVEPAYDCYVPAIQLNGGIPVYVQLKPNDYHIDWEEVRKVITQKTKMIILCTPHNPAGSILSAGDMKKLEKLTKDTDIIILSDEVYEHIIFDGYEHQSIARYPELAKRSIIVYSFGKTFHATGWKIGYCIAPENIMKEYRKVHQWVVFTCNTPMQYALADFLKNEDNYMGLGKFYQEKRDYFINLLSGSKFGIQPSCGSYFQLLDYSNITDEIDTEYAIRITKENGIA